MILCRDVVEVGPYYRGEPITGGSHKATLTLLGGFRLNMPEIQDFMLYLLMGTLPMYMSLVNTMASVEPSIIADSCWG